MNQRSFSNLGMSKSHYIPDQNRTSSAFYKRDDSSRLDRQLARYEEFKRNYKRNELQYSYYFQQPREMNQSFVEERYSVYKGSKHLQTQQDYDNYRRIPDSPIKVELNYTAPNSVKRGAVVSDTAAYLKERDEILNSYMSQSEIERIKRIYFRK